MNQQFTISNVARQCGMSVPNIRFYEAQGIIPAPRRTDAGYRLYSQNDVRRLRLARRARLLGLSLPEVRALVERAFASECGAYAQEILHLVHVQRTRIDQQIAELQALRQELDRLKEEAAQISRAVAPGQTVSTCSRCLLVDEAGDEGGYCACDGSQPVIPVASVVRAQPQHGSLSPEVVDTLVCDLGQRPVGAPTLDQITGSVTSVRREVESLLIEFGQEAAAAVQEVVAAERRCCATLSWDLRTDAGVSLRIGGTPSQLDALESLFGAAAI